MESFSEIFDSGFHQVSEQVKKDVEYLYNSYGFETESTKKLFATIASMVFDRSAMDYHLVKRVLDRISADLNEEGCVEQANEDIADLVRRVIQTNRRRGEEIHMLQKQIEQLERKLGADAPVGGD